MVRETISTSNEDLKKYMDDIRAFLKRRRTSEEKKPCWEIILQHRINQLASTSKKCKDLTDE